MGDLFPLNSRFAFNIQIRKFVRVGEIINGYKIYYKTYDRDHPQYFLCKLKTLCLLSIIFHFPSTSLILPKLIITHLYTIALDKILPNCKTKFEPGSTHSQTIGRCLLPYGGLLT